MRQSLLLFVSKDFLFRCRLFVVCCCFDSMQISSSRCHFPPHPFPCGAGPAGTDDQLQRSSDPRMVSLLLRSVSHWQDGQRGPGRQSCKKLSRLLKTSFWMTKVHTVNFNISLITLFFGFIWTEYGLHILSISASFLQLFWLAFTPEFSPSTTLAPSLT